MEFPVLDTMALKFGADDDVAESLIPIIAENGGRRDHGLARAYYPETRLDGIDPADYRTRIGPAENPEYEFHAAERKRGANLFGGKGPPFDVEAGSTAGHGQSNSGSEHG